jgi:hypothetical protein
MNQKTFAEALIRAADSDATDNRPKRHAVMRQSYYARRLLLRTPIGAVGFKLRSNAESEPRQEEF